MSTAQHNAAASRHEAHAAHTQQHEPGSRAGLDLAALFAEMDARDIRLHLAKDRQRFTVDAPRGSLSLDLQAAIRTHKAAILAALTETPPPVRAVHVCGEPAAHFAHWRYSAAELRYVCLRCFPEMASTCPDAST